MKRSAAVLEGVAEARLEGEFQAAEGRVQQGCQLGEQRLVRQRELHHRRHLVLPGLRPAGVGERHGERVGHAHVLQEAEQVLKRLQDGAENQVRAVEADAASAAGQHASAVRMSPSNGARSTRTLTPSSPIDQAAGSIATEIWAAVPPGSAYSGAMAPRLPAARILDGTDGPNEGRDAGQGERPGTADSSSAAWRSGRCRRPGEGRSRCCPSARNRRRAAAPGRC